MVAYVIRRLLQALIVILIVSVMIFSIIRLLPGDPIEMLVSQNITAEDPEAMVAQIKAEMGLDRPLLEQYFNWLGGAVHGDLGLSILYRYDIGAEIGNRLPITLALGLMAFLIGIIVGPLLGIISAIKRGTWIDNLVTVIANIGITAPAFWVGIILIYILGLNLGILPIYGYTSFFVDPGKSILQSIMPVFVLSLYPIASAARQTRSSVIEVLKEDYVRTAWAKGLSQRVIVVRHVLKNALMPVVTLQGLLIRNIVGGSVIIESVFVIPGMGKLMVDGMLSHDYTVVQGVMLVMAIAVVLTNLLVDLAYGWLDPRIQYD